MQWIHLLSVAFLCSVIETVDCTVAGIGIDGSTAEQVRRLADTIVNKFQGSAGIRQWINGELRKDRYFIPNTELVEMQVVNGIRCSFSCGTPDALRSLYISVRNDKFSSTLQLIFSLLLGLDEFVFVVKTTGSLNLDGLLKRIEEFNTAEGEFTVYGITNVG
jgi:hypothetical protein